MGVKHLSFQRIYNAVKKSLIVTIKPFPVIWRRKLFISFHAVKLPFQWGNLIKGKVTMPTYKSLSQYHDLKREIIAHLKKIYVSSKITVSCIKQAKFPAVNEYKNLVSKQCEKFLRIWDIKRLKSNFAWAFLYVFIYKKSLRIFVHLY